MGFVERGDLTEEQLDAALDVRSLHDHGQDTDVRSSVAGARAGRERSYAAPIHGRPGRPLQAAHAQQTFSTAS
jgi:hypothetical protein